MDKSSVELGFTAIDPAWVKGLRAWIKSTFVPKQHRNMREVLGYLEHLKNVELNKLFEYMFYTKGLMPRKDGEDLDVPPDLRAKIAVELRTARDVLAEVISDQYHALNALTDETSYIREFYLQKNPQDPEDALFKGSAGVIQDAIEKVEGILSGKMLRAITAFLTKFYDGRSFETPEVLFEHNIGAVKLVYDGDTSYQPGHASRSPRDLKGYLPGFLKAKALLERKGFGRLWYGPMFVSCPTCGGKNQHGEHFGVGAHYNHGKDRVTIFMDPKPYLAELVVHELGHRYYFKFMSQKDRLRFDSYFGAVAAVSEYGGKHPHEDFAEVFAHYVMGYDLTRDQLDRFKAFLAGGDGRRMAAIQRVADRYIRAVAGGRARIGSHSRGEGGLG